jgi:UDP-glucuronate 4-epimerase
MKILVTGAAGFIGYHVAERLLERGDAVVGLDNVNPYYDPALKEARVERLRRRDNFRFVRADLADRSAMETLFAEERFSRVLHLAAQPGVRYSVTHPHAYVTSNLVGFLHVLEGCRQTGVEHLTYASSSSVYGLNTTMPFSERHPTEHPASLYAATKKSNELMAHSYAHIFGLPVTGLRFFTVYGPWDRPDMGVFLFTTAILAGKPIELYNFGEMRRDFTFIDDIAEGIVRASDRPARPDPDWSGDRPNSGSSSAPYRIYNIGSHQPVALAQLIDCLEQALGRKAELILRPMQRGDVPATFADVLALAEDCDYRPTTPIEVGIAKYVKWYREYYQT